MEARPDRLRAVRETRRRSSEAFTLRGFHVDAGEPAAVDDGAA